jgi:GDP-L-fucose synthase
MKKMKTMIFGSKGMVGRSLVRILSNSDTVGELIASSRDDTNLFSLDETMIKMKKEKPDIVINAAAKVGGIHANNTKRTEFIFQNLKINMNILEASINFPETKIINLGSSCIYPLEAENPIKEDSLMTGELEPTNSPYAIAKIAAIEMGRALNKQYSHQVINLMPTNLYGPYDNFSEMDSHVIPGLIMRMHKAKVASSDTFKIWGSGTPLREFLYVDDLAEAVSFLLDKSCENDLYNVGFGEEISIMDLAFKIKNIINFQGELDFDSSMPDGNPRKLIDTTRLNDLGWRPITNLDTGLEQTYKWYLENNIN